MGTVSTNISFEKTKMDADSKIDVPSQENKPERRDNFNYLNPKVVQDIFHDRPDLQELFSDQTVEKVLEKLSEEEFIEIIKEQERSKGSSGIHSIFHADRIAASMDVLADNQIARDIYTSKFKEDNLKRRIFIGKSSNDDRKTYFDYENLCDSCDAVQNILFDLEFRKRESRRIQLTLKEISNNVKDLDYEELEESVNQAINYLRGYLKKVSELKADLASYYHGSRNLGWAPDLATRQDQNKSDYEAERASRIYVRFIDDLDLLLSASKDLIEDGNVSKLKSILKKYRKRVKRYGYKTEKRGYREMSIGFDKGDYVEKIFRKGPEEWGQYAPYMKELYYTYAVPPYQKARGDRVPQIEEIEGYIK